MGNPCFYYYPVPGGALQTINLGTERLSDLVVTRERPVSDAVSRTMGIYRDSGGMRERVQIVMERFKSDSLVRQFNNLSTHLERGGWCGFTLDTAKLWAGYISGHSTPGLLYQGHQLVTVPGSNSWSSWSAGELADDDPIVIESYPPESIHESHRMNGTLGATSTTVFFDDKLENNYRSPAIVRYRDFWPCLKIPQSAVSELANRPIVVSHRRLNHTLDLTLVVDWEVISKRWTLHPPTAGQSRIKWGGGTVPLDHSTDTVVYVDGLGRVT